MVYSIYVGNFTRLNKKLTRIKNKCEKFDNYFKFEVIGKEYKQVGDFYAPFIKVDVEGTALVSDWRFVAVLRHKKGGNIIEKYDDTEIPMDYRDCPILCDHCKTDRARKDTYIVQNKKTGEFKQVGKSCLADYTHGLSAEMVASYISMFNDVIVGSQLPDEVDDRYYPTNKVLELAIAITKTYGYVSKQKAFEMGERQTSYRIFDMLSSPNSIKSMYDKDFKGVSKEDTEKKIGQYREILEVIRFRSEYYSNLYVSISEEYCSAKDVGLIASIPMALDRYISSCETNKNSKYVGEVGKRISIEVESAKLKYTYVTEYGNRYVYEFKTSNGDVLVWRATKYDESLANGLETSAKIQATIKAHNEYKGQKQTEVLRVKMAG